MQELAPCDYIVRTFTIGMSKINELINTFFLPDSTSSNYFLLPKMEEWIFGIQFGNIDEVESTDCSYYKHDIDAIECQYENCN